MPLAQEAGPLQERPALPKAYGPRAWSSRERSIAFAVCLGLLLGGSAYVEHTYGRGASLYTYAADIQASLQEMEAAAAAVVADDAFLRQQVFGLARLSTEDAIRHADRMLALSQERYNILLYEGDSLHFWTSNQAILPEHLSPSRLPSEGLRRLSNGFYFVKRTGVELFAGRQFDAVTLIPIRMEYAVQSDYLRNSFVGAEYVPSAVALSEAPTGFQIESLSGTPVAYLARVRDFTDRHYQAWLLGLHGCILAIFALGMFGLARVVERRHGSAAGAATIVVGALAVRAAFDSVDLVRLYPDMGFLARLFETQVAGGSLAGLLVNVVLAMWLVTFFHRSYRPRDYSASSLFAEWMATGLHYLTIVGAATALTFVVEKTIKSPGIEFDLSNVLNLSGLSIVTLIALLTLIFSHFLLSHRLMLAIGEIGLSKQARFTSMLAAMAVAAPALSALALPLPLPHFLLGCALFILVYDLFIDTGESNVLWLFFWLVVLAIYSAVLFFTFNEQKDLERRLAYAEVLSHPRDVFAEEALARLDSALARDLGIQHLVSEESAAEIQASGQDRLARLIIEEAYLYHNYKFNVYCTPVDPAARVTHEPNRDYLTRAGQRDARLRPFGKTGSSGAGAAGDARGPQASVESTRARGRYAAATPVGENLRLERRPGYEPSYLLRVPSRLRRERDFQVIVDFRVGPRAPSKFLSELLIDEAYRGLRHLDDYQYAIYHNGSLIQSQGGNPTPNLRAVNVPSPGSYRSFTNSDYSEALYAGEDGVVVIIGKAMGGYLRPMSLFSYLFVWCIILTLLMSVLNTWIDVLPEAVDISWVSKPDLKTKIQVGVIALVLLSFAMIGYVTVLYFHDSTDSYHDNRLNRKVASILENVEHEIDLMAQIDSSDVDGLARIIGPISKIHSMDVNLFDLNGELAATSETELYKRGVVAPRMGAYARQLLADRGIAVAQQYEAVGMLKYRTAYVPVRATSGSTIAYLGLPYYSKQRDLRDDVGAFMGTLLNVYVFLLLIAGVIAISVANSITRPLTELGDKIRRFRIDDKLQPLEWKAHDELGDLIREFNTMLFTVEASAKELDNARRESAWREMAQQVAHEIKNPLTPMKLSIEFLRHAFARDPSPAALEPLIQRVSGTLIEQIDNLASIATNFSTFARMPEPANSDFELDELVRSVYNLFLEEDVDSHLEIREGEYPVFADKKLVMRVLNNLVKNAIQAIPDQRRGQLSVSLQREGETALVCVGDNGAGIPVDMQEKVFFPKFTTKSSGSGLGLAICRDIIHAAHGRIYFETEVGVGTRFYFSLPIASRPEGNSATSDLPDGEQADDEPTGADPRDAAREDTSSRRYAARM